MSEKKDKKKKIVDLTGGTYQPSEQLKQLPDGTFVRLEDPTVAKTQEEIDKEKAERISEKESE